MELVLPDWKTLPLAKRQEVMEQIWDSIQEDIEELPVPDWHLEEIERRLASYGGKLEGIDGHVVIQRLRALNGERT